MSTDTQSTHTIDAAALSDWLAQHLAHFKGPVSVEKFAGGQSNPTYKLTASSGVYVLRCKPGPVSKLLPSAHAIEREFKVMRALAATPVPVPTMHVLCEDESVIGRAFYLMAFETGRVLWDQALPDLSRDDRSAIYWAMNQALCALHMVDINRVGLQDYGRPGNYFERQINRWSKQYTASVTTEIPAMDALMSWLPKNLPATALDPSLVSIVHGDYRLDNLIFHPTKNEILAILDWELSTIGHPLADFSYHCMSWHIEPGDFRGIGGLDLDALGIPAEAEYIAKYCETTGFISPDQLTADWPFYMAYNLFRLAAILQGIAKRVEAGTASSEQARRSAAGASPLAALGWKFAQQYRN